MKKTLSVVLAVLMITGMTLSVYSAEFADTIEVRPAPGIIKETLGDGKYGALIINGETGMAETGVPVFGENADGFEFELSVVSSAEKVEVPFAEISDLLIEAENRIKSVSDLGKLCSGNGMQTVIDKYCGDSNGKIRVEDTVVTDLFCVSLIYNRSYIEQLYEGGLLRMTLNAGIPKDGFFALLHSEDGNNWEVLENVKRDKKGNLVVTVDGTGVFAIAAEKRADLPVDAEGQQSPLTGYDNGTGNLFLFAFATVFCTATAAVFFVKAKKKK